jgi:O-methyltransferase involved in polyketide biosynthesis
MLNSGKLRVNLSGAPQTMLATLYAKALDADLDPPVLGDRWAKEIVERIDYDWAQTAVTVETAPSMTTRSAHIDQWASEFLAANSEAVVLHLGCGLDSRFFRLNPGPGVEWFDVDHPDVAELRRQLYPKRDRYHVVGASVTDPEWLAAIAGDRPVLLIAEGLTMYLKERDGVALLRRVVEQFPSGELQFDAFNRFSIRTQWTNSVVRRSGSTLHWGVDSPRAILKSVPGLRLLDCVSAFDTDVFRQVHGAYRVIGKVMSLVPPLRNSVQYHRYEF